MAVIDDDPDPSQWAFDVVYLAKFFLGPFLTLVAVGLTVYLVTVKIENERFYSAMQVVTGITGIGAAGSFAANSGRPRREAPRIEATRAVRRYPPMRPPDLPPGDSGQD